MFLTDTVRSCRNPRCITQMERYLPPLIKKIGGADCCGFCDAPLE